MYSSRDPTASTTRGLASRQIRRGEPLGVAYDDIHYFNPDGCKDGMTGIIRVANTLEVPAFEAQSPEALNITRPKFPFDPTFESPRSRRQTPGLAQVQAARAAHSQLNILRPTTQGL